MKYQTIDIEYYRNMKEIERDKNDLKLMLKGLKYGYFLTIFIIILSALFNGNLVLATPNDIDYTFQNDNLYETTTPVYSDSFNIRNTSEYTGLYNATYSFDLGFPPSWVINDDGGSITIIDYDNHDSVMRFRDVNTDDVFTTFNLTDTVYGTYEYWIQADDVSKYFGMYSYNDSDIGVNLAIRSSNIQYRNVASTWINILAITNNQWYHISIDFECGAGAYKGLTADHFYIRINGIQYGEFELKQDIDSINNFKFYTSTATADYTLYLDAFGNFEENYSIGVNLIPYLEVNKTIKEVDKWEFSYSDFPIQYAVNSDIFSDWTEIDTGDYVNIAKDHTSLDGMPLYFPDRKIKIHDHTGSGADIGIERDFNILDGIINISWSINFTVHPGVVYNGETTIEIYSNDDTLISRIYSEMKRLCYKDSGGGEVILGSDVMHEGENYDFNFYNNPYDNITLLRFDIDGVNWDTYVIPNLDSSKRGLGKIKFINYHESSEELIAYLDNIGVYSNGTSISTEPAFRQIDLNDGLFHTNWDFPEANLLTLNLKGNIGVYLTDWYFYISPEADEIEVVLSVREFDGTDIIYNLYDHTFNSENYIYSPRFWFEFYDQIELETDDYFISMDGVVLDDGVTNYHLEFTSQNVETYNSYFYVSGDSLYFMMEANENGLEYIQASFDILNVFSGNRSLLYKGQKSGTSVINAQFLTYYSDTTYNYFNLEANYKSIAVLLPRDKTIDTFDLLITDDGSDLSDTIIGFLGSFTLLYVPLIATDFVSISFFDVLPIVVLVVIIPIALYIGFDKKKELLVPSIMAMSIFGTAVGLIPLWLTFVIGFGCVSYYLIGRRN